jgi:hypothetical protein
MARTNREIIEAWQCQGDREDCEAYEGCIGLGLPNHIAIAVERKERCTAAALAGMANSSGGIVDLGEDSSVGSDVEEIREMGP